ncbi:hypothetical protein BJV82DRAFT_598212 [Fennellomyces sp. T-0311]|nr:hypothetical protein BJV82DRAFT_598212 [Fennellomyces sp. T-0311]
MDRSVHTKKIPSCVLFCINHPKKGTLNFKVKGHLSPRRVFFLSFSLGKNSAMAETNDKVVTAVDIVDQQQALEQEAKEALPGKFEKCTYDQGYIRQQLYSCKTCQSTAGFCYSCSIACHADHELFELFPKRHFRCDCGLQDSPCTLHSDKEPNTENAYNHNFDGRYCRCDQVYDPEDEDGTMYQCVVCEDWFHDRCIGEIPSDVEAFESYVCRGCTKEHPFLIQKPDAWISIGLSKNNETIHRWITPSSTLAGQKRKLDAMDASACLRVTYEDDQAELFLNEGWRSKLCQCKECAVAFKEHKIEFLLSEEETFEPEEDEDAGKSLMDAGMEHIMRMDRVQAMESIMAYKALSSQIKDFLQTFKDSGQVVTESHIRQFFAEKRLERSMQNDRS